MSPPFTRCCLRPDAGNAIHQKVGSAKAEGSLNIRSISGLCIRHATLQYTAGMADTYTLCVKIFPYHLLHHAAGNHGSCCRTPSAGHGVAGVRLLHGHHAREKIDAAAGYGVSVGGAAAHNCGQIAAACLTLGSMAPLYYLPILLGASLITGAVTGVAAACLFRVLAHTNIFR